MRLSGDWIESSLPANVLAILLSNAADKEWVRLSAFLTALKYFLTLDLLKVTRVLTICFQLLLKIDRLYSGADDVDDKEKEREWDEVAGCGGCVVSGI